MVMNDFGTYPGCDGTVIVHEDRTFTCTNNNCSVLASADTTVSWHTRFLACQSVFTDEGCPRCSSVLLRRAED
jgi:hypothetical protein